jgi:hypothetical protein
MPSMVTDRNYWGTYRDDIAAWYGELPPPGKLGVERAFEFARHILEAAEREQVLRTVFVPAQPVPQGEDVPTWLELMRAKFEQEGRLRLFPAWSPDEWLGGGLRELARLAYFKGDRIVEEDVDDVGALEKSVVSARGGDPEGIRFTRPLALSGGSHNEPDQPLSPGRPPTREISISLSLYTDIWFPRVIGLDVGDHAGRSRDWRHPARGGDGLMDNSALAARHTPRLNRFIEALRDAILELGGTWGEPDVNTSYKSMVHRGGILLDYPAGSA